MAFGNLIGGVLAAVANTVAPSYSDGALIPLSTDLNGNLRVAGSFTGTVTEASIGATGAAVPASANYAGMNVAGILTGLTGSAVGLKVDASGATIPVNGTKSNNAAAPGSNNIGTLGAVSNAAQQTWTEGNQVGLSVDLNGNLRTSLAPFYVSPGAPISVSVTTVSASATVVGGAWYRVACDSAMFFRIGTGATTALTTDSKIFGPSIEEIAIPSTANTVAFIMTSGTGSVTLTQIYRYQ